MLKVLINKHAVAVISHINVIANGSAPSSSFLSSTSVQSYHFHLWGVLWYKVVQIWPGLVRLVYTQISPGHIGTTLYNVYTV